MIDTQVFSGSVQWVRPLEISWNQGFSQWLSLVPLKGGRWHIIPQLAVYTTYNYTTYILPSVGLYATYHLLGEPETTIDFHSNPNR